VTNNETLDIIDELLEGRGWVAKFREKPVSIEEFTTSSEHMKNVSLSPKQVEIITGWLGNDPTTMFEKTSVRKNLAVYCLGKGAGKNMMATIIQAYVLYVLLCMRDPLGYFGFPQGESIDMVNVAATAVQAKRNFFDKLVRRIVRWNWLRDRFILIKAGKALNDVPHNYWGTISITEDSVEYSGGIKCISAHSDSKGYEGYSPVLWVMDEASSWETEYIQLESGEQAAISKAHSIFDTLRTSAVSRSWKWAGLVISYPRQEDDFTLSMANNILEGKIDGYAAIAPTWDVKPWHLWTHQDTFEHKIIRPWGSWSIFPPKDFEEEFRLYPQQSELKYACVPSRTKAYFIYNNIKIHECADDGILPLAKLKKIDILSPTPDGSKQTCYTGYEILDIVEPNPDYDYYCHIDLSISSDTAVLGIGHGEPYEADVMLADESGNTEHVEISKRVVIDQLISWQPDHTHLVSHVNIDEVLKRLDDKLRFRYLSYDQFNCLELGTPVLTNRGIIPIGCVVVGDTVQSKSGPAKVLRTNLRRQVPTLKITTTDGDCLELTENHRLEVLASKKQSAVARGSVKSPMVREWVWREAKDFQVGDVLHMWDRAADIVDDYPPPLSGVREDFTAPNGKSCFMDTWTPPSHVTVELAEWLGLVWGDGHVGKNGVEVTVASHEAADCQEVFTRLFGACNPYESRGKNHGVVAVRSRWLVRWMEHNGLCKPAIPDAIMCSGRVVRAAFIRGLFSADGSVDSNDGKVSFCTKHSGLVHQVQSILRMDYGIESHIAVTRQDYVLAASTANGGNQEFDAERVREYYYLQLRGSRAMFANNVGFCYGSKSDRLQKHIARPGRVLQNNKIVSVTTSVADVVDIEVEGDHSFIANGFVSHNSQYVLEKAARKGKIAGKHNVNNKDYFLLRGLVHTGIIRYPKNPTLILELEKLIWTGKRVDHQAHIAGKDYCDVVAGIATAIMNELGEKRQRFSFHFPK
jgi:hypothetical protein